MLGVESWSWFGVEPHGSVSCSFWGQSSQLHLEGVVNRTSSSAQFDSDARFDLLLCLYPVTRKFTTRSTGPSSPARRRLWTPPTSPCRFPKDPRRSVRSTWAPPPRGGWACWWTTGTESYQTTVRAGKLVLLSSTSTTTSTSTSPPPPPPPPYHHNYYCC